MSNSDGTLHPFLRVLLTVNLYSLALIPYLMYLGVRVIVIGLSGPSAVTIENFVVTVMLKRLGVLIAILFMGTSMLTPFVASQFFPDNMKSAEYKNYHLRHWGVWLALLEVVLATELVFAYMRSAP